MSLEPKVAIVILNWNGLTDTRECLESISKLKYSNYIVIIIDNGSTDNSGTILMANYPDYILIDNHSNKGYAGGNNIGIERAVQEAVDYIWLLNNDTIVDCLSLREMIREAEINPSVGLVSPLIYYYDVPDELQFCGSFVDIASFRIVNFKSLVEYERMKDKSEICLYGTALLIKRTVITEIGLLDEKYFAYSEDQEYCHRAYLSGYHARISLNAWIFHKVSRSTATGLTYLKSYYKARNTYFLWRDILPKDSMDNFRVYYYKWIVHRTAKLFRSGHWRAACASFEGALSAKKGIHGKWEDKKKLYKGLLYAACLLFSLNPRLIGKLAEFSLTHVPFKASRASSE